jgi:high affinity Mn2+ porin
MAAATGAVGLEAREERWAVHAQATFVVQAHPGFKSPYQGTNSLDPEALGAETSDMTFYAGVRPWRGGEIWINPEIDQGFGLSDTLGVAAFPSGEAYKVGKSAPYLRLQRLFLRQTWDLGGERSPVAPDINVLGGAHTRDRVVLTLGKFSVVDVFDTNGLAHDPRSDFLNWALIDTATFDYAADAWGYTVGAALEVYKGDWVWRAGLFDLSEVPNSATLDPDFSQFQAILEAERGISVNGRPGRVRLTGFLNRGRMGSYVDALTLAEATNSTPSTADVRRYRSRGGVGLNLEQALSVNVGLFARAGWAQGNFEPYEFTDVDWTGALDVAFKGARWGRPDDVWGLAAETAAITPLHRAYFAAGGLGILIGDGQLPHYGYEQVVETYYSLPIGRSAHLTGDYQFVLNPAYNRDRGPVSVFALRIHVAG